MQRMKRLIAGILCMVMLLSSVPIEALAVETTDETQSIETLSESVVAENSATEETVAETESTVATEYETEATESETEATEATESTTETTEVTESETETTEATESTTETTEVTESETEATEATESETEAAEATESETEATEATESETEATEPTEEETEGEEPRWIYSVNEAGYAVIEGYTDYDVTELSIPYSIDGYYVAAIGTKAFAPNTALAKLTVHGNVQTIAEDAFEGLGVKLVGYNGTTVLSYATAYGYSSTNLSNNSNLTFVSDVVDLSYTEDGRYVIVDGDTIKVAGLEASQLEVGSIIYLPESAGDGLLGLAYEVTSLAENNGWIELTVATADAQDVLMSFTVEDEDLIADWDNAVWADGVSIVEEKLGGSISGDGSINLEYSNDSIKALKGGKLKISGKLELAGKATLDYDVWHTELKELSVIVNPNFTFKSSITWGTDDDAQFEDSDPIELDEDNYEVTVYIGEVPLMSVSGLMTVKAGVYAKVSVSGEVSLTFKVGGKFGAEFNRATGKIEGVCEFEKPKWSFELKGAIEIGPAAKVKMTAAIIGDLATLEYFHGLCLEASVTTDKPGCFDADLDVKRTLEFKLENDKINDALKKINKNLNYSYKWTIFERRTDIASLHYERGNGWVDECQYEKVYTVDFCTFTSQEIASQRLNAEETVTKPSDPTLSGNEFLGWYTSKDYATEWNFDTPVTSDLTLYAKWNKSAKTVLFSTNYDGGTNFTDEYIPGSSISKPSDLKRMDYVFEGWFKDAEGTEVWDFSSDIMPDSNLTLYAGWTYQEGYDPFQLDEDANGQVVSFEGHEYQFIGSGCSWENAKAYCEAQGGYLATITSQEEQDFLFTYIQEVAGDEDIWIGMTDVNREGDWSHWITGEAVSYTNWGEGEPDDNYGSTGQNYGVICNGSRSGSGYSIEPGEWDDIDYTNNTTSGRFLCEWGDYEVDESPVLYKTNEDTGETYISGSSGTDTSISIGAVYNGTLVTSISEGAFYGDTTIENISIPTTVTTIGDYAFASCTNLEEIVIPDSVTSIGIHAFDGCTSLKKVTLPSTMTELPEYMFYGCTALEEVVYLDRITNIGAYAFYGCTSLANITYSEQLTTIGARAFYGCTSFTNGKLPNAVTSMGTYVFRNCTALTYLTIPTGLKSIPNYAFYNCTGLATVIIPKSVTSISSSAFTNVDAVFKGYTGSYAETWCGNNSKTFVAIDNMFPVRYVVLNDGSTIYVDGTKAETMTEDTYVESGTRLTEPVVELEGYELEGWYTDPEYTDKWDFATDTMPESELTLYAKWVEADASFGYTVENGQVTITDYNGTATEVAIPETLGGYPVTKLAAQGFAGNSTMKKVTLPVSLSEIEAGAFQGCSSLFTIAVASGNTAFAVSSGALYSADGSELIYLAEGRTVVSFVVPDTVTSIYSGALSGQDELTKVEIPDSVTSIGENAFPMSSFLVLYGSVEECAAKTYAENNGLGYNLYKVTFYEGEEARYAATWQAGTLIDSYYEPTADFAEFGGWYKDAECTAAWDFETDLMPAANLSLYLKWNSDFEVTVDGENVTITGYTGTLSDIIIPETLNGYAVTGVASGAFISKTDVPITSVTIPATVTEIAEGAVTGAPAPQIVGDVGSTAETYATSAGLEFEVRSYTVTFDSMGGAEVDFITAVPGETLELPTPVRSNYHFMGWYTSNGFATEWTEEDVMPAKDMTLYAYWKVVNSNVANSFSYEVLEDGTACITQYAGTKISLSIPETINGITVTAIGDYVFNGNETILTISIPETVTTIGSYAFAGSSIRTVNGGEGITTLGESCFSGASGLTEVTFLDQVNVIPDSAFRECSSLTEIVIPEGVATIEEYAFYGCDYLGSVTIPESVTEIGTNAFANCGKLTAVEVPGTLKELDDDVFDADVTITYTATSSLKLLEVKQVTKNSVSLEWNEVEGADGYYLYRKQGSAGTYSLIKTVTGTTTSNYSLTSGITYYYKVQAYTLDGTTKVKGVESEEIAITISSLTTPEIAEIVQASSTTANMSWSKINGAEGYEVYRAYSQSGEYTYLKTVEGAETVNTGLLGGMTYYYKVRAYSTVDGETVYSAWSDIYKFAMPVKFMEVPANLAVRMTAPGTVHLSWDKVEGADGYNVYRQTGSGSYSLIKSIIGNETYNYNLTVGNTYGYKVSAYYYNEGIKVSGEQSEAVTVEILTVGTPYIKSVTQSAAGTALVKWSSVGSADGYELYRSRTENGTYSLMKSVTGIETSNYNLTSGVTYYYKVRAYIEDENGNREYGAYSAAVPVLISDIAQTRIKSVVQADGSSAKVTWATLRNAEGYEVWRSAGDNAHYELVRDTSGTAIQDRGLNDGMTYYYKIRAYKVTEEEVIYGTFSEELYVKIISTPELTLAEQVGTGTNEVMWSKITSADGYEVWSSESADGTFALAKDVPVTTATIYNLTEGVTYYYKVRAYYMNGESKVYGSFSGTKCVKVMGIPEITKVSQNGANAVNITWSAADAVEGYELYRSTNEAGPYEKIKSVTGTSTGNYSLEDGGKYYYKLRGYVTVNGKVQYGPYSDSMGITLLNTPVISVIEQKSTSSCEITWEAVENATSYKLYRSTSPDSGFTLVKAVAGTTTVNYSLSADTTYYYKVKAVMEENGTTHDSAYSEEIGIYITSLKAVMVNSIIQNGSSQVDITYNVADDAEGIEVWRSETEDGEYTLVGYSENGNVSDSGLCIGVNYYYKARAYITINEQKAYSVFSQPFLMYLIEAPEITYIYQEATTYITMSWEGVEGAEGYEIWKSVGGNGEYEMVKTVTGAITSNYNLVTGETYSYKIRAYRTVNGIKSYSDFSEEKSIKVISFTTPDYPESEHEYSNNVDQTWTYTIEGADALLLKFSNESATENNYDKIYIMDESGNVIRTYTGSSFGGSYVTVPGDTIQIRLTTDGSNTNYGFSFEFIKPTKLRYQLFETEMSWEDAKAYCEELGGHLATITSELEQRQVAELVANGQSDGYWLGSYIEEGNWLWITGENYTYENWDSGEPNGGSSGMYMWIYSNGEWDDTYGDYEHAFLCEWD